MAKKILAMLLILTMILPLAVACNVGIDVNTEGTTADTEASTSQTTETTTESTTETTLGTTQTTEGTTQTTEDTTVTTEDTTVTTEDTTVTTEDTTMPTESTTDTTLGTSDTTLGTSDTTLGTTETTVDTTLPTEDTTVTTEDTTVTTEDTTVTTEDTTVTSEDTTVTTEQSTTNDNNNNENDDMNDDNNKEEEKEDDKLAINGLDISDYVIVVGEDAPNSAKYFAEYLVAWIRTMTGTSLSIVKDSTAATEKEILIGSTNRAESTKAMNITFSQQWTYNAIIENNKLAIAFDHKIGSTNALHALKRAFINSDYDLTEGFSNNAIALEDVKDLVMGAVRKNIESDGLHVHKTTQAQIDAWHAHTASWSGNKENPRSATGIRLDFDTDSSYVYLKLTKNVSNLVFLVNDELVVNGQSTGYISIPEKYLGQVNRITLLMSNVGYTDEWAITDLEVDGGCVIERHKTDLNILFLGDSITEGYNNHGHPASTYTFYTHTYFNAEAVVQGHGGSQLWPDMVDPEMANLYQPDVIIVAMGTNDYSGNSSQSVEWFRARMNTFLDKVQQVYPNVPIIGITPIRRLSSMNANIAPDQNYDTNCVARANAGYALGIKDHNGYVVNGETILSKVEHYADTVHPNEAGFQEYGEVLCFLIEYEIEAIVNAKKNK